MDFQKEYRKAQKQLRELRRELRETKTAFDLATRYKQFADDEYSQLKHIQIKYFEQVADMQELKLENKILIKALDQLNEVKNG
jgi:hypothetical protein